MKYSALLLGSIALSADAFPAVMELSDRMMQARALQGRSAEELHQRSIEDKRQIDTTAAQAVSKARGNCGILPCLTFNAEDQLVSTTGEHAYQSPAADEIRGPCPGLNAAANHGYLSRSGVLTLENTVEGLGALYNMSPELAAALAAYGIIFDGDPVAGTWSIGGPQQTNQLTKGLLGQGQGISWSHNIYEGDSSIGRRDAYINNGDAHSLDVTRFAAAYAATDSRYPGRYTLDSFAQNFDEKAKESVATNPYYFTGPFSTTVVSPAAYNFVINFMSNHSAEEPNGYLDGDMFKTFFAVTGDTPEEFEWLPGQERVPDNWYRRTSTNQYTAQNVFTDLGPNFLAYPDSFRLGGNTNGVNTYSGISLTDFTGGAYNLTNVFRTDGDGRYGACFFAGLTQSAIPDFANLPLEQITPITNLINDGIKPIIPQGFDCPTYDKFDQTLFNQYPGHTYSPTGPATNY
ncbi:Aromatic peroxygenase [Lecanosticta acicola]|uniref:Aromatic peroxygenase n=1 Tax=Lecanosticta acicola TaxID=111012 RepID=A0AAI9EB58_9PEZI|nr:Aromatic peroxygenase [Lecanosticta acicola]